MSEFSVGDVVLWSSQAGGQWAHKKGVVVEVIEANTSPSGVFNSASKRSHVSYVVRVDRVGKKGKAKKPEFYWPVVSGLTTDSPAAPKAKAKKVVKAKIVKVKATKKPTVKRKAHKPRRKPALFLVPSTVLGSDGGVGSPPDYQAVLDKAVAGVVRDTIGKAS